MALFACLAIGCGGSNPQVDTSVPAFEPAPDRQPGDPRPKGMPENTSEGLQIDPVTGRPTGG